MNERQKLRIREAELEAELDRRKSPSDRQAEIITGQVRRERPGGWESEENAAPATRQSAATRLQAAQMTRRGRGQGEG